MKKPLFSAAFAVFACLGLASSMALAQAPARKSFGKAKPFKAEELPAGELKSQLQTLPPQAKAKAMQWLHTFDFSDFDAAEHLRADKDGGIFIVCPDEHGNCDGKSHKSEKPEPVEDNSIPVESIIGEPGQASDPPVESASVPVSSPPAHHSKPGAARVIYLDFNGATVSGKAWSATNGTTTWRSWDCHAWSSDSDRTTFSDAEQANIKRMWERVAEDYAPFDIDVTTDAAYDPDNYTGDKNKVGWLLITPTTDKTGARCPHYGYGGIAYVGVFGNSNYFSRYQPAWVTASTAGYANMMEAASHEMGHNMGLSHDGTDVGNLSYYSGHAATSTAPSWGPLMGTGYNRNVSQWCKGDYYDSYQSQDDLSIISARVPYRADDHGDSFATATSWPSETGTVTQKGVVETTGNADYFAFSTGGGPITFNASPYKCDTQTWGSNLDILLELYDSTQTLVASSNPAADVTASISQTVSSGNYYLVLKPVGAGSPLTSPPSGYTNYSSLGQYTITGAFVPYQTSLGLTDITPTSGDSGSTVTVNITGSALAADTTVKLKQPGRADISGTSVQMIGNTLRCQFNLTGAASGLWSLHASNPDLQTATLANAFTVNGVPTPIWSENFDGIVTGWASTSEQGANSWDVVSTASQSPAKSYFSIGPAATSITHLTSPSISIPSLATNLTIEFWHNYALEQDLDCGKFYLSIDGGAWFEVTSAGSGAAFTQNGYNSTMAGTGQTNPFAGQQAWSGTTSGAFVKTAISLTDTAKYAGKNLQLRWTIATNNQTASTGWYVDSISLDGIINTPNQSPIVTTAASTSSIETETVGATTYQIIRGTDTNLSVAASDDVAESYLAYTWTSTGGPAPVVFSTNGNNAAKNTTVTFSQPGDYLLTATVMDTGGLSATSSVNVRVLETQTILVTPETILLTVGDTKQYAATAINQFGTPLVSQPSPINWSASGGGTISNGGLFTANTIGGPYTITASGGSLSGTAEVSISPYPASVELQNLAQFYDGSPKPVTVTTTPSGLPYSVTYNGQSTAPTTAGSYAVEVTVTDPNYQGVAIGTLVIAYKVSYQGNSNTSGTVPADQIKLQDVDLTLATNSGNLNKADYSFAGWNTAADGSGTAYPAGGTYTGNASLTLYAVWIPGADGTWIQATAGPFNWTDAANWSGGTIASGADRTANFTANITANQVVNLDSARTIGNITFTDSTTASNDLTISGANVLNLVRTSGTPTINVTNRALTISSVIAGSVGLKKSGAGTLVFTSGSNNTFTGGLEINAGTVQYDSTTSANAWGDAANIITFTGNATLYNSNNAHTLARGVAVNSGITATLSGAFGESTNITGPVTGEGNVNISAGSNGWAVTMSNTANTLSGTIWVSSNAGQNTSLSMNSLADGASQLKLGNTTATADFSLGAGTIAPVVLNNRQVVLSGTTGAVSIKNNAGSSTNTLTINTNLSVTATGAKTLTLGGSNTGTNTFGGNIANGSGTVAIAKADAGTWILSGTNTYSGKTTGGAGWTGPGTLIFQGKQAVSPNTTFETQQSSGATAKLVFLDDSAGVISLNNSWTFRSDGGPGTKNTHIFVGNNSTANGGNNPGSTQTGSTIALGGYTSFPNGGTSGSPVDKINITGANGYKLQLASIAFPDISAKPTATSYTIMLNPTTAPVIVAGGGTPFASANLNSTPVLNLDGTATGNEIQGAIADPSNVGTSNPLSLTKSNSSTWTLSGNNSFSGGLTLSGATAGSQLNINSATALGTGTFTINGGNNAKFDNTSGSAITLNTNNPQTWTNDFAFLGSNDLNLGTGAVTMGGNRAITLTASTLTVGGAIAGSGFNLTKAGNGTLILGGANTYTGTTTVSAGKLFINGDQTTANGAVSVSTNATLGGIGTIGGNTTIAANGRLEFDLNTSFTTHNKLELATGKTLVFSGASVLTITSSGSPSPGDYTLVTAPGGFGASVPPATVNLPIGWTANAPRFVGTDLKIYITSTGVDTTAPILASITDDKGGGPVAMNTLVTYTVTFTEDMDATTFTTEDFGNAGSSTVTIGSVTETSPGVFTVQATPTSTGNLQLRINQNAVLKDVAGNNLNTASDIADDTTLIIPDTSPPTLAGITDDKSGGPVTVNTLVSYTVTFSEDMDAATVTAADFGNAGTSAVTIGSVSETLPGVFTVEATPTTAGTLQLQINAAAVLEDLAGNALDTVAAITDDTILTVTVADPYTAWSGGAAFDADANGDGVDNGLAWLLGAADKNESALNRLPVASRNGANLRLTFRCLKSTKRGSAQVRVQSSGDLGASDPWTSHEAAVPDLDNTVNGVVFDTMDDGNFINVIADIPAAGNQLFGRLNAASGP